MFPLLCFRYYVSFIMFPLLCFRYYVSVIMFPLLCFLYYVSVIKFPLLSSRYYTNPSVLVWFVPLKMPPSVRHCLCDLQTLEGFDGGAKAHWAKSTNLAEAIPNPTVSSNANLKGRYMPGSKYKSPNVINPRSVPCKQ